MIRRFIGQPLEEALSDSPVVLLHGARQTGKTTLAQAIATQGPKPRRYLTLDDATILSAAHDNPEGFVRELADEDVTIDEVQRAPALFQAIKLSVDRDRRPGRFLLTGSANVLSLPKLSESLAGRMEIIPMWPLAAAEVEEAESNIVDAMFSERFTTAGSAETDVWDRVLLGGFPEVRERGTEKRRRAWFGSYVTTILQRDVREIANIENLAVLPRLLTLLASRIGGLLNVSDIGRSLALPQSTLKRYLALLQATFLLRTLPAWSSNLGLRLMKSPKLYVVDTGLASSLLGVDRARVLGDGHLRGGLLENFVVMELTKQASWSERSPELFHFRTSTGQEVDVVLEDASGNLVGVEIKARATAKADDFKGLRKLQELSGDRFHRGVLLYCGIERVAFGDKLVAIPVSSLW